MFNFIDDDSSEWLDLIDAFFSTTLVNTAQCANILEIGVWKGAWSIDLLLNRPEIVGYGIDPYPGFETIRAR